MPILIRRALLACAAASAAFALAGCVSTNPGPVVEAAAPPPPAPAVESAAEATGPKKFSALYAPVTTDPFPVPGLKPNDMDQNFVRNEVNYVTREAPGTIVIDTGHHFLYLVEDGGRAMRYGVGVGREGFGWSGTATIKSKQEWPDWYPPKEMIDRTPGMRKSLAQLQSGIGMPGGPRNPLGARAMYLWQDNKDTLFRIHGTVEPRSIGKSVSSGCIRMIDQDVMDLYNRTPVGTKVVVLPSQANS